MISISVPWGLPANYHTDETVLVERALALPKLGFNPNYYQWPGHLPMYVHSVAYASLYGAGRMPGPSAA